jgi:CBS domain-containing protein
MNGRLHDLINRHRLATTRDRVALQRHVSSSPVRRDAILDSSKHNQGGESSNDENRARPHHSDYTVGFGIRDSGLGTRDSVLLSDGGGTQPMNIREVMTPNPQCVAPGDSIQNAARIMRDCDTGAVPVVDNGRPVGIVTDRDIVVRAVADGELNRPVREIVSGDVICATPEMSTHEAAHLMSEHQVRRLPVVENERIVGIVSLGDLAVKEARDKRVGDTLEHISEGVKERGNYR